MNLLRLRFEAPFDRLLYLVEDNEEQVCVQQIHNLKNLKNQNLAIHGYVYNDDPLMLGLCHGLLCLMSVYTHPCEPKRLRFLIHTFNLITGEYQQLPHFDGWDDYYQTNIGFGYDVSSQKFKVVMVRFYTNRSVKIESDTVRIKNQVFVHTLGSFAWRRIVDAPSILNNQREQISSVFVNGSLHWITSSDDHKLFIVTFNLGVEEFKVISTPESLGCSSDCLLDKQYKLGVLEGCLSLVDCTHLAFFDMWVFQNNNEKKPWVNKFSIRKISLWQFCNRICPIRYQKNGEILLLCDDQFLVSYDTKTNTHTTRAIKKLGKKNLGNVNVFPALGSFI
ncbi:hypothetical protein FRX31_010950 [Thalictrum thalictroides]|uniref:F-box associated beta-propeller type 3 domain-containing protein n=1 Tax=Thalictrum thalictroides TaxID=46969 RepID=A0A7J6WR86_THATH|nr:hypothetical protein FRX31_010950 [Thalictrum thalictroides]